jgi:hypothetical protein
MEGTGGGAGELGIFFTQECRAKDRKTSRHSKSGVRKVSDRGEFGGVAAIRRIVMAWEKEQNIIDRGDLQEIQLIDCAGVV